MVRTSIVAWLTSILDRSGEVMITCGGKICSTRVSCVLRPCSRSAISRARSVLPALSSSLITSGR